MMLKNKVLEAMGRQRIKSGRELARRTGVAESNIYRIINGESKGIQFNTLENLCRVLDCQPGDLLEYVPDDPAA